jgi:hypothetical protein
MKSLTLIVANIKGLTPYYTNIAGLNMAIYWVLLMILSL